MRTGVAIQTSNYDWDNVQKSSRKPAIIMELLLYSITHNEKPVEVREKVCFDRSQRACMLENMRADDRISEAVILETCNRVEFYLYAKKGFTVADYLADLIEKTRPGVGRIWRRNCQSVRGIEVVRHLFSVAAGLSSQMIGENQVLSQVKSAYRESTEQQMSKFMFHRLFHQSSRVGKAVRTQTDINCGAVSIGLAAVQLAQRKLKLSRSQALLIGAGENAQLVARHLVKRGLTELMIANRNRQKAEDICCSVETGFATGLEGIEDRIKKADLLVGSTASSRPLISANMIRSALEHRKRKLLVIDIAVPRDIEPKAADLPGVELYNIDDLNEQIELNRTQRRTEIPRAEKMVNDFTDEFARWYETLDVVPVISALSYKAQQLARSEARRYAGDFAPENAEKLRLFAESLAKKLLHGPISFVRNGSDDELTSQQAQALDLINKMFLSQDRQS